MATGTALPVYDPDVAVPNSRNGEPVWAVATYYPLQGMWTEEEYLQLDAQGGKLIEFDHGRIEFLPMPTLAHQMIVFALQQAIHAHARVHAPGSTVAAAPLPVRLTAGRLREPDLVFLSAARRAVTSRYPDGADWVIEVVSPDAESHDRDHITKRELYAAAGIGEYWIVDPQESVVIALVLDGTAYREAGRFVAGDVVPSTTLPGLTIAVSDVWAAQNN